SKERHLSGILAVALVGSTPAIVVRDAEDGTESPAGSCRHHFEYGNLSDSLQQFRVARTAQADVVWENDRPRGLAIAVHGVDAKKDRQVIGRALTGADEAIDQARPLGGRAGTRDRRARRKDGTQHL